MLNIEIVSDIVCPWCFIGTRRLAGAIAQVRTTHPDFVCRKIWRPFFLNPDTPPQGEPYLPFLIEKFGSRERVESIFVQVRAAGQAYGLDYAFEKIQVRANTLQAHRLIAWAQADGDDATPLVEALFAAQFQQGRNVGDPAELLAIATACAYPAEAVRTFLAGDDNTAEVRALEREGRRLGINMVPTFILDGRRIIVGAEDPAVLAAGIREILAAQK